MRISLRSSSRVTDVATPANREARSGFVLVEVIVAMVLLAIAVSSLAGLVYSVSRSGIKTTGDAYKNGVLMHEVNRLVALPYDSVATGPSYYGESSGSYPHTRFVNVAESADSVKSVTIVISPHNPKYKPDTARFVRTKARTSKVLCQLCS